MKRLLFLPLIIAVTGCKSGKIEEADVRKGKEAIDICASEYEDLSGHHINKEVDRAYVLIASDKIDLLFARGEVGTFGRRSSSYSAFLTCGLLTPDTEPVRIYWLSEPLRDPLIHVPGIPQITDSGYREKLWDLMYMRTERGFRFAAGHEFKPDEIGDLTETTER